MTDPVAPRTLLLVDGSSYLYRAFHAMPDLRAKPGDPQSPATGAIRGMVNMLQKLRKDVPADYAACVFDAKGPTFRDALYPDYKANRSPMPDDLRSQIPPIHEVVRLMGWQVLDVPGVEADDVIGTLAQTAAKQGVHVTISSGDKDLSQLVDEHITVIDTMNGKRRDLAGVEAEFGVPPRLMVDYQALVGDTVDNVPGVTKVGPKTAAKWLEEYGSLDNLIADAHAIKGRGRRQPARGDVTGCPRRGRRAASPSKTDCDAGRATSLACRARCPHHWHEDSAALKTFYEQFGFKGLVKSVTEAAAPAGGRRSVFHARRAVAGQYAEVRHPPDLGGLQRLVRENPGRRVGGVGHRNHLAGRDARRDRGPELQRDPGRGGLHPAHPPLCRCARPAADRCGAGAAQALAGRRQQTQARPARQVRPPRVRQPRHRGAGLCARHHAAKLCAGGAQAARAEQPGRAAPGPQGHPVRRPVWQGRAPDFVQPGGHCQSRRILVRRLRPDARRAPRAVAAAAGRRQIARDLRTGNGFQRNAVPHRAQRRADRRAHAGHAEPPAGPAHHAAGARSA